MEGPCPSLPGLLSPANACPHRLRGCRARGLYTDPLFIGGFGPEGVWATFSSVLALLTWVVSREERRKRREGWRKGPTLCLLVDEVFAGRRHWTACSRSLVTDARTCVSSTDVRASEIALYGGQRRAFGQAWVQTPAMAFMRWTYVHRHTPSLLRALVSHL